MSKCRHKYNAYYYRFVDITIFIVFLANFLVWMYSCFILGRTHFGIFKIDPIGTIEINLPAFHVEDRHFVSVNFAPAVVTHAQSIAQVEAFCRQGREDSEIHFLLPDNTSGSSSLEIGYTAILGFNLSYLQSNSIRIDTTATEYVVNIVLPQPDLLAIEFRDESILRYWRDVGWWTSAGRRRDAYLEAFTRNIEHIDTKIRSNMRCDSVAYETARINMHNAIDDYIQTFPHDRPIRVVTEYR